jgi:hypothetical protein
VDDFEIAERNVLGALFIDSHRPGDRLLDRDELARFYGVHLTERWFSAIVADLETRRIVMKVEDKESSSAVLLDSGFKAARKQLLGHLGASGFDVNWHREEILTNAKCPTGFPLPVGSKWLIYEVNKIEGVDGPLAGKMRRAEPSHSGRAPPPPRPDGIHWTKWGTIFGGASVVVGLLAVLLTLVINDRQNGPPDSLEAQANLAANLEAVDATTAAAPAPNSVSTSAPAGMTPSNTTLSLLGLDSTSPRLSHTEHTLSPADLGNASTPRLSHTEHTGVRSVDKVRLTHPRLGGTGPLPPDKNIP